MSGDQKNAWFLRNESCELNRNLIQFINENGILNENDSLLEVGCCYGYNLNELSERGNLRRILGVEQSELAVRKGKNLYPNIDFLCMNALRFFRENTESFDVIIFGYVFYNISQDEYEVILDIIRTNPVYRKTSFVVQDCLSIKTLIKPSIHKNEVVYKRNIDQDFINTNRTSLYKKAIGVKNIKRIDSNKVDIISCYISNDNIQLDEKTSDERKTIPYGRQTIDQDDINSVVSVLVKNTYLTTGPLVDKFENDVQHLTNSKFAVAVNSGTAALHCAVHALGIHEGDEVIVPAISFVASANCVLYEGGIPIFADVNPDTLNIDPSKIRDLVTSKTKAIIVVHYAGQLCEMKKIKQIADEHNLKIIEDAAHAIGTQDVGKYGDLATFSFHPVKNMTTGEGGMVITNNSGYHKTMKQFRTHGITIDYKKREKVGGYVYDVNSLGYNYRLTDIQCALGISQLRKLSSFVRRRKEIAALYDRLLSSVKWCVPLEQNRDNSYHIYVVKLIGTNRDTIFKQMKKNGVNTNVHYKPIYQLSLYVQRFGPRLGLCPNAEFAYLNILTLPIFPTLSDDSVEHIVKTLVRVCDEVDHINS